MSTKVTTSNSKVSTLDGSPKVKAKSKAAPADLANFQIHSPSEDDWTELIQNLHLKDYEAHLLRLVVDDMVAEIKAYQLAKEKSPDRDRLKLGLSRIEKAFAQLEFELDRFKSSAEHFLPHAFSERLGDILNFSSMAAAINENIFPENFDVRMDRVKASGSPINLQTIETEFSPSRRALGLKHGHKIFPYIVRSLHAPLISWFELDRLNRGGRPRYAIRQFMIERLARIAPEIVGCEITTSTTNPAFTFCSVVLSSCGLPEEGLERAIAETFRKIVKTQSKKSTEQS